MWLSSTKLRNIKYKIVIFKTELLSGKISKDPQSLEAAKPVRQLNVLSVPQSIFMLLFTYVHLLLTNFNWSAFQLTFARFYLSAYFPEAEKAIYLDDDVIVQGTTIEEENYYGHKPNENDVTVASHSEEKKKVSLVHVTH